MQVKYVVNQRRSSTVAVEDLNLLTPVRIHSDFFQLQYRDPELMEWGEHILGEFATASECLDEMLNIKRSEYGYYCVGGFTDYKHCLV